MRTRLILALGLATCGPDVEVPTWSPVDLVALEERLNEPPGSIESLVTSAELIQSLATSAEFLVKLTESLDELRTMSPPLDDPPPPSESGSGTIVFVEIACPGSDPDQPVTDYSSGWVRIDIPGLQAVQALRGAYAFEGSVLLSFVDCRRGTIVFNGRCPLFVARDGSLAFSARLTVTLDGEPRRQQLFADGVFTAGELRFILGDLNGITVSVALDERTELRLSGRDGQLICRPEQASCETL